MSDTRSHFHAAMNELEVLLLDMGESASQQVADAVLALATDDTALANSVVESDKKIDQMYVELERRWHEVMAQQTPVASDLRLMSMILTSSHSMERVGDQASNIARIVMFTARLPHSETIVMLLQEMSSIVVPMLQASMESLIRRDLELALQLPEMDDPVDRINRNMWKEVVNCGPDPDLLEWAIHMILVSRALERVGDRAVDIGEQVAYLLTGEFREFPEAWAVTF